jgi:hypothetical protein
MSNRERGVRLVSRLALWSALAITPALWTHAAGAQEDAAESRSASFQAVEGATKEDVPGFPLLVAAYGTILVVLVAYVARLGLLQRKNGAELTRLTRAVERAGRKD